MDYAQLRTDLRATMKLLPPEAIEKVGSLLNYAFDNLPKLAPLFPQIGELLGGSMQALMFEKAVGALDTDKLESMIREVFAEFGLKPKGM